MRPHWDLHRTIFAATGSTALASIWDWASNLSWASAIPAALSSALTVWQFVMLRKRELSRERVEEADLVHDAALAREKRRREQEREQDRLDAELALELARRRREARGGHPS